MRRTQYILKGRIYIMKLFEYGKNGVTLNNNVSYKIIRWVNKKVQKKAAKNAVKSLIRVGSTK